MLASLPFRGHPLKGRWVGARPGRPPRHTRWGRMPFASSRPAAPSRRGVAHDVEAGPRVAGIPRPRRVVLDRDLTTGAGDDDGRREPFGLDAGLVPGDGEPVVLDEHRLPAAVDDGVEDVQ